MRFHSGGGATALAERAGRETGASETAVELRKTWIVPASNVLKSVAANRFTLLLQDVGRRGENWDRRGSAAARSESVARAISIAEALIEQATKTGPPWRDPIVGLDENGDVSLEWWRGARKLTLYVAPEWTEYVKSWGPNMDSEMEVAELTAGSFQQLWHWLDQP